ncbi:hypothetical protein CC86DRAFT_464703 [Ophiobolus disseminans]|uniref:Kelch repeat protein n=1 Tax=Ophiobolus disseminans TaxID=1469910 RepID=A0A6A7A6Q4_9PLEO|nr:hypothetical protein CC86DRAFT_464703 [Ophiobolus disseminans]
MKFWRQQPAEALIVALSVFALRFVSAQTPVNLADVDPLKDCNRREVKLIESDNKVYMYGGQSWMKNGTSPPYQVTNHFLRIVDFTTARDLSDRSILLAKEIPGTITIFQWGAFWADSKRLYVAGGAVNDEPWLSLDGKFLPTNYTSIKGGSVFTYNIETDRWLSEPGVQPTDGSTVTESWCCGSFGYNAPAGKAYFYSGTNGAGARRNQPNTSPVYVGVTNEQTFGNSDFLTFDTTTFKWKNATMNKQLTTTGTENGQFVFLPGTSTSGGGLGVQFGGRRRDTGQMETMRKVLVYDSANDTWYSQATTVEGGGDFPDGRWWFCAVAASARDNSSHSIYMYGGESPNSGTNAHSDMWVLSVPSFRWVRVSVDSPPRKSLGCAVVGQSYMVTYGGVPSGSTKEEGDNDACDQDNYGLRLFDMSKLAWTSRYEGPPTGGNNAYKVPKVVYNAIGGNEEGSATRTAPSAGFETPGLASLFQRSSPTGTSTRTPTSPASQTSTGTVQATKKKTNVGAIAGGILGGLVVLAIILVGVLWLLKRKRSQREANVAPYFAPVYEVQGQHMHPGELPAHSGDQQGKWGSHEIYTKNAAPQELYAGYTTPKPAHAQLRG